MATNLQPEELLKTLEVINEKYSLLSELEDETHHLMRTKIEIQKQIKHLLGVLIMQIEEVEK